MAEQQSNQWRQAPDGSWWFMGPDGQWHPSTAAPSAWDQPQSTRPVTPLVTHPPTATTAVRTTSTVPAGAWIAIVGGVLMAVSSFLPWMTAHVFLATINRNSFQLGNNFGFSPDGLILIGLGLVTVIVGITRLVGSAMPRYIQRSTIVTGIGALLVAINRGPSIHDLANNVSSASQGIASASIGYGLWIAGLAGVVAIVGGLVLRAKV